LRLLRPGGGHVLSVVTPGRWSCSCGCYGLAVMSWRRFLCPGGIRLRAVFANGRYPSPGGGHQRAPSVSEWCSPPGTICLRAVFASGRRPSPGAVRLRAPSVSGRRPSSGGVRLRAPFVSGRFPSLGGVCLSKQNPYQYQLSFPIISNQFAYPYQISKAEPSHTVIGILFIGSMQSMDFKSSAHLFPAEEGGSNLKGSLPDSIF